MSELYSLCGKRIYHFQWGYIVLYISLCVCVFLNFIHFTLTEIQDIKVYQILLLLAQMEALLRGEARLPRQTLLSDLMNVHSFSLSFECVCQVQFVIHGMT